MADSGPQFTVSSPLSPLWLELAVALGLLTLLLSAAKLYRHAQHPLSRFPGPRWAAFSNIPYSRSLLSGRKPYDSLVLHEKYGTIVRIAPNELSFSTASSWSDIYGYRKGHQPFLKSKFYEEASFAGQAFSIVTERDPAAHANMRKYLGQTFADKYVKEQEYLVTEFVDQFIHEIGERGREQAGVDLSQWLNLMTFDLIGSLAFGQSFGGLVSGETHSWIDILLKSMAKARFMDVLSRFPWFTAAILQLFPGIMRNAMRDRKTHEAYAMEMVKRRLATKTDRKDYMTKILEHPDGRKLSEVQLAAQAADLVIAGSETSATAMAAITYYLLRAPALTKRLQGEVRGAFGSYDEINGASTAKLRYLNAVISEGLRLYPPVPLPLVRIVPPGGDTIDGHYIPAETIVSTCPMAASLSSHNFADPWKFDPDRWLKEEYGSDNLEASQPFSLGPRACLGRGLALMEMRIVLAKMHFCYDLKPLDEKLDWHAESAMQTFWKKPPLNVQVTRCRRPTS